MNQLEVNTITPKKTRSILIDISTGKDAKSFRNINEVIQKDAVTAFFRHVKSSLDKVKDDRHGQKKMELSRYHDTIAVFGGRGTGKTTFILNVFEFIRRSSIDDDPKMESILPDGLKMEDLAALHVLPILDPTLVEAKEHVFVNIISRIKEEVELHYQKISGGYPELMDPCSQSTWQKTRDSEYHSQFSCSSKQGAYTDWQETLRNLAAGLPALDGIGGNVLQKDSWQDPVHVMEEGLKCVRASNRLERNFHCFVEKSLEFIGKKVFILAFDDVDTDFQAGWPVLEIIRKYLTTPRLITVLSGDPGLYAKLIRKYQWEHFGKEFIKMECQNGSRARSRENFHYMVNQLEDQYFLKILKPKRRIELKSLLACQKQDIEVNIKIPQDRKTNFSKDSKALNEFLNERIIDIWSLGKNSTTAIRLYREFLLDEPIRSLVQILSGMADGEQRYGSSLDALVETYFSNLYRHGFVTDIRSMPPAKALTRLVVALADNQLFDRGYRLKPEFFEKSANRLMLVLGAIYTRMIATNADLFFDYFIKIGLTRQIGLAENSIDKSGKHSILKRYMQWTGISAGEDALTQSRYHTGFIRVDLSVEKPVLDKRRTLLGTVALKKYDANSPMLTLKYDSSDKYRKTFRNNVFQVYGTYEQDSVVECKDSKAHSFHVTFKDRAKDGKLINVPCFYSYAEQLQDSLISSWQTVLIGLPGLFIVSADQDHTPFWSIHNLIACIGGIIRCEDGQGEHETNAMKSFLLRNSQLRAYDLPVKVEHDPGSGAEPADINDEGSSGLRMDVSDKLDLFAQMLIQWRNDKPKESLPVHIIAKMFARFYYSLGRVDDAGGVKYLGETFYRYIVLFFNSVLVEEALHRDSASEIGRKNPSREDDFFNNNMKKAFSKKEAVNFALSEIKEKGPFFYWILCCPVWHSYLNPEGHLFKCIVGSSLYEDILKLEEISYKDFLKVKYAVNKDFGSTVSFDTLYPVLNSVLIQNMRAGGKNESDSPKTTKNLPSWKISNFDGIRSNVESEIENLKKLENDDQRTECIRDKFIEGKYINVPRTPGGKSFEALKSAIIDLINGQK